MTMYGVSSGTNAAGAYARYAPTTPGVAAPPAARPSTYANGDVLNRSFNYASSTTSSAAPRSPGIWNQVRAIFGLPPVAPRAPVSNPGVFDRLRAILGFGPPIQPSLTTPAPQANQGLINRLKNFFHIGRQSVTGSFPGNPTAPVSGHIRELTPAQLRHLGQQKDKTAFFQALLPAAIAAERQYGVPASVTLAQAALESGWAKSPIGGYNIFGIKGKGSAGSTSVATHEYVKGVKMPWVDNFALYRNFEDAMVAHGKLFHNGRYDKGIREFAQNRDPYRFVDNVGRTYATDPNYAQSIKGMMQKHGLVEMARAMGGN